MCVCLHAILAVYTITSKTKDTIVLSVEFEAIVKRRFSLTHLVRKLERFYLPRWGRPFCLDMQYTYVQCFVYSPLHVRLRVMHVLSYGDKSTKVICMIACV